MVTTCRRGVGLESRTVIWVTLGTGTAASPVTENPDPDVGIVVGVIVPTVEGTENVAV